jgi:hypothetical protein
MAKSTKALLTGRIQMRKIKASEETVSASSPAAMNAADGKPTKGAKK